MRTERSNLTFLRSTTWVVGFLLIYGYLPKAFAQGIDVFAGKDSRPIRLNLLRPQALSPNGQALPYEWSAAYLRNAFGTEGENLSRFLQDSSLCGTGLVNSDQFEDQVKVYYGYTPEGQLESITFMRKGQSDVFENYSRKSFFYEDRRQNRYLFQTWAGEWQDVYEENLGFNPEGQLSEFVSRETDGSGSWVPIDSVSIVYEREGNPELTEGFSWVESSWVPTFRQTGTYNQEGNYTSLIRQEWNGGGFVTRTRESATYGPAGTNWLTYELEVADSVSGTLSPLLRERYGYDNFGFWRTTLVQMVDSITGEYQNVFRESYQFTRRGLWTGWLQQVWEDSSWQNALRQSFSRNAGAREQLIEAFDVDSETWLKAFRSFTRFDDNENLVREMGTQVYNPQTDQWVNQSSTRSCEHSWSTFSLSTANRSEIPGLDCLIQNPYSLHSPIACEAMELGKVYDLNLINMEGRTLLQRKIPGGTSFQLDRNLPVGLYQMAIQESGILRHLQKLIIQSN